MRCPRRSEPAAGDGSPTGNRLTPPSAARTGHVHVHVHGVRAGQYEYNAQGQVIKVTDPLGRERVYEYASNGIDRTVMKRKESGSLQTLETRTYDSDHRPLTVTDRDGGVTTFTYNARGQVLTVQTPPPAGFSTGPTTSYTYDSEPWRTELLLVRRR